MVAGKGTWATNDVITATGLNSGYDSSGNIKLTAAEKIVDANDNEIVEFTQTGSAVNNIKIANAATGANPSIIASGEDVGIALEGVLCKNGSINDVESITRGSGVLGINGVGGMTLSTNNATRWTISAAGNLSSEAGIDFTVAGKLGCNGKTAQASYASGGASTANVNANGAFDNQTTGNGLITLVNNIRAALVANGIMS